jgi:hypothetical protein
MNELIKIQLKILKNLFIVLYFEIKKLFFTIFIINRKRR